MLEACNGCSRVADPIGREQRVTLQEFQVRLQVRRSLPRHALHRTRGQAHLERARDLQGDLVLDRKDVPDLPVEAHRPHVRAVGWAMSWAVIRRLFPERRTLPSSTWVTLSLSAMSRTSAGLSRNRNDDDREITRRFFACANRLRTSSAMPSARYPWSFPALMSTNGRTAIELCPAPAGPRTAGPTPGDSRRTRARPRPRRRWPRPANASPTRLAAGRPGLRPR